MDKEKKQLTQLEIARIIGEPKDPRRPYPMLVEKVAEVDSADPEEYVYYFDVLQDTDKVYVVTSTGAVTQENVSPDTPAAVSFVDLFSPEYYVKFTDLAKAKERVVARKLTTINRALNAYENYKIISVTDAAVQSANSFQLSDSSGSTWFNYEHLIKMLDAVKDYGDKFVLVVGTQIDKDILLWDWNDNKYMSLKQALDDLNIEIVRINQTVTIDGASTSVLDSTKAYLYATDTEVGKPTLFVRKKLNSIELLGGVIADEQQTPERLVFSSPNPITVTGTARYLAYGLTGFEEIAVACTNPYALAKFTRS